MSLASSLGLPIESVNSAADYFVHRIPDWREQLEPLHRGSRSTIYRPTPTLFLLLKLARLSSQDLADCLALLERVRVQSLRLDAPRVQSALDALGPTEDADLAARRSLLRVSLPPA